MTLEFELYEEKRRRMRRFSFLKGSFATLIVITLVLVFWNRAEFSYPHIAKFKVFGEIYDDPERDLILRKIEENEDVYGLIVTINSPGGTVVGAEALYESLKRISKKKPVVVSIGEVGASAAYRAALAGDKIFARGNSLVGSIGVIVQYPNLSELADFLGVSMQVISSGKAKGGMNPLEPPNENSLKNQELLVNDSFMWFKNLVSERRKLNGKDLDKVSGGQLFTGRMALELGLIDALGSASKALKYFQTQGSIFKDMDVKDWSSKQNSNSRWKDFLGFMPNMSRKTGINLFQSPILFSIAS